MKPSTDNIQSLSDAPQFWEGLRPEVQWFALAMETELRRHDNKPGWKQDNAADLFDRMHEEAEELGNTLFTFGELPKTLVPRDVLSAAADVANFCMMIADVSGAFQPTDESEVPA